MLTQEFVRNVKNGSERFYMIKKTSQIKPCPKCGARKTKYIPEVKKLDIYPPF
jgi:predicted  nucleic acid-binding Zn-ribbon protein